MEYYLIFSAILFFVVILGLWFGSVKTTSLLFLFVFFTGFFCLNLVSVTEPVVINYDFLNRSVISVGALFFIWFLASILGSINLYLFVKHAVHCFKSEKLRNPYFFANLYFLLIFVFSAILFVIMPILIEAASLNLLLCFYAEGAKNGDIPYDIGFDNVILWMQDGKEGKPSAEDLYPPINIGESDIAVVHRGDDVYICTNADKFYNEKYNDGSIAGKIKKEIASAGTRMTNVQSGPSCSLVEGALKDTLQSMSSDARRANNLDTYGKACFAKDPKGK